MYIVFSKCILVIYKAMCFYLYECKHVMTYRSDINTELSLHLVKLFYSNYIIRCSVLNMFFFPLFLKSFKINDTSEGKSKNTQHQFWDQHSSIMTKQTQEHRNKVLKLIMYVLKSLLKMFSSNDSKTNSNIQINQKQKKNNFVLDHHNNKGQLKISVRAKKKRTQFKKKKLQNYSVH